MKIERIEKPKVKSQGKEHITLILYALDENNDWLETELKLPKKIFKAML